VLTKICLYYLTLDCVRISYDLFVWLYVSSVLCYTLCYIL